MTVPFTDDDIDRLIAEDISEILPESLAALR